MPNGYLGNTNITRRGTTHNYTVDQIKELARCRDDIVYFSEKYFTIVNLDLGKIKIPLYDYQKDLLYNLEDNRFNIVLQSRQSGKTTTMTVFILHYILFNEDKEIALLANKGAQARKVLGRIKLAYELIPKWLKPNVVEWNKGTIEFENGCIIAATATSSDAARGDSVSLLVVDEAAFIDGWDEFYASTYPTIASGKSTKVVLISTANGLNHYHHLWQKAINGRNEFVPFEVKWQDVPGRDDAWKKQTIANTSVEAFSQEHENVFMGGTNTLISMSSLRALVPINPIHHKNNINIYHQPIEDHTYMMVVDVSRGKGLDYSAFSVIDITEFPFVQAATFRDNTISPLMYPDIIFNIALKYNDAWVLVENNDIGGMVVSNLNYDFEYENLLSPKGPDSKKYELGVRTTKRTKSIGCSRLRDLIENTTLIVNDQETINELCTFVAKGKSYEADANGTDDLVMGLVMFAWMTSTEDFSEYTTSTDIKKLIAQKSIDNMLEDLLPVVMIEDGLDDNSPDLVVEDGLVWEVQPL